ncbi:MAG: hypothetical protein K6T86_00720 [Pirellulales bacterium]|nr:hypothetical protein [Pirellulales bacterium]
MRWLDPPECTAAQDALERGNLVEAASVLLACPHQGHRRVRQLLTEISAKLIRHAREEFAAAQTNAAQTNAAQTNAAQTNAAQPVARWDLPRLEAAARTLELAARCAALNQDGLAIQQRIAEAQQQHRDAQQRLHRRLTKAQEYLAVGRLDTALEVIAAVPTSEVDADLLERSPQAAELREECTRRLRHFERHVQHCRAALEQQQIAAARRHWEECRKLYPTHRAVQELENQLAQAASQRSASGIQHQQPPLAVTNRSQTWLLGNWALVLSASQAVVGTTRDPEVQVPILGKLHARHALLYRDATGWHLNPCRDKKNRLCPVIINGRKLDAPARLRPRDTILFGDGNCAWQFTQPVQDSGTVVLEAQLGTQALIWANGHQLKRLVLMADRLVVRPASPAHVVVPTLPANSLEFCWTSHGLEWRVEHAVASLDALDQPIPAHVLAQRHRAQLSPKQISAEQAERLVYLHARLQLEPDMDEAERLDRGIQNLEPHDHLVLDLLPGPGSGP